MTYRRPSSKYLLLPPRDGSPEASKLAMVLAVKGVPEFEVDLTPALFIPYPAPLIAKAPWLPALSRVLGFKKSHSVLFVPAKDCMLLMA